ncbi:MAG: hypothetical protein GY838_12365 [bacterium]|nr:hypothetical protein [bacterium]
MKLQLPKFPKLRKPRLVRPTMPDRSDLVLVVGGTCLVAACLFVFAGPGLDEVRHTSRQQAVRANAATLQLAAETFAAMHQGRYATDPLDLVPLLPGDRAPRNPYTGDPVRFTDAPGDLTYRAPAAGADYLIEAWGDAAETKPLARLTSHGNPRVAAAVKTGGQAADDVDETVPLLLLSGRAAGRTAAAGF